MGRLSNLILGTPEQRDHNARFNTPDTDPNSAEYLASHDRVIAAQKAAKTKKK
jgi:hypothetical protein